MVYTIWDPASKKQQTNKQNPTVELKKRKKTGKEKKKKKPQTRNQMGHWVKVLVIQGAETEFPKTTHKPDLS